jgi:hypothetical protein
VLLSDKKQGIWYITKLLPIKNYPAKNGGVLQIKIIKDRYGAPLLAGQVHVNEPTSINKVGGFILSPCYLLVKKILSRAFFCW